jgi:hypothetical protein
MACEAKSTSLIQDTMRIDKEMSMAQALNESLDFVFL